MRSLSLPLLLSALLPFTGCRDLGGDRAPFQSDGGGPLIRIDSPKPDEVLPARWRVEVTVEDVDGVGAVSLSCGLEASGDRRPLHAWSAAPYIADLDLGPCIAGAQASHVRVQLLVLALDGLGNAATGEVGFTVDRDLPEVVAEIPARVRPGQPVELKVTSGTELAGPPVIRVDGAPLPLADQGDRTWTATFVPPPVGAAAWTGAGEAPLAALEQVERTVSVTVAARSAAGNELSFTRELTVSVVAWERELPAQLVIPDSDDRRPVATAEALSLALAAELGQSSWVPARLDAVTGALTVLQPDAELAPLGFGADGRPLMNRPGATGAPTAVRLDWSGAEAVVGGDLTGRPLVRLPDRTCVQRVPNASCQTPTYQYQCAAGASSATAAAPATSAAFDSRITAVSGATVASLDFTGCGGTSFFSDAALFWTGVQVTAPLLGDLDRAKPGITRLLPVGAIGRFALTYDSQAAGTQVTRLVDPTGFLPGAAMQTAGRPVLFTRPASQSVVTGRAEQGRTRLESFTPGVAAPVASVLLPGLFEHLAPAGLAQTHLNAAVMADDRAVLAGWTHSFGRAVVGLNADLSPAFVYRYPRGTGSLTLVHADVEGGLIYLIDATNHRVTALHRTW